LTGANHADFPDLHGNRVSELKTAKPISGIPPEQVYFACAAMTLRMAEDR
jgi:hypothetical protein